MQVKYPLSATAKAVHCAPTLEDLYCFILEDFNDYPSHFTKLNSEVFALVGCHAASHIQRSTPLKIGPIGLPETSVTNYESTLHDL